MWRLCRNRNRELGTRNREATEARREAYEHILNSLASAHDVLIECAWEIDDIRLDPALNNRDINRVLNWMFEVREEIYQTVPELAPPPKPTPRRRWATDPKRRGRARYTRDQALYRLEHNLNLAGLILRESLPFARSLRLGKKVSERLASVEDVRTKLAQEIWKELPDHLKRLRVAEGRQPKGVAEPPPADRDKGLARLNEKLETASKLLNDCAELVVELDMPNGKVSAVGTCLALIFDVQDRVWKERPDLIPQFLKGAYELREREAKEQNKKP
jgi:hypothetical protein